jgi:hypothetical protein
MIKRVALLVTVAALSVAVLANQGLAPEPATAQAAVGPLTFSTEMTGDFKPAGQVGIEFPADNNGVFVTFPYSNLPAGASIGRIVRWEGSDYNFDKQNGGLSCCPQGGSGQYGFRITRRNGDHNEIPGGAYDVRLYLNGVEIANAGFGVKGTHGGDNDNQADND